MGRTTDCRSVNRSSILLRGAILECSLAVERLPVKEDVTGSIPVIPAISKDSTAVVQATDNRQVGGSNPSPWTSLKVMTKLNVFVIIIIFGVRLMVGPRVLGALMVVRPHHPKPLFMDAWRNWTAHRITNPGVESSNLSASTKNSSAAMCSRSIWVRFGEPCRYVG